jgi:geranylgeranyl pyrophosphate synthase
VTAPQLHLDGLALDRRLVDDHLAALLPPLPRSPAPHLREAMRYAVFGPGRRIRPILALRVAQMLGAPSAPTLRAAAAVELLHCASLIVDDLPCMDNDATRRNRPSVHIAFGEATAILAAFGLVSLAARSAADRHARTWERLRLLDFQLDLLATLDCASLIGGQSLDLELSHEARNLNRARLAALKTVPLFELAVRAGAAFADLSPAEENSLLDFGAEFGIAYQMRDDHFDGEVPSALSAANRFARACDSLAPFGHRAQPLRDLVEYLVS